MAYSPDEVAGVADLFGALAWPALRRGLVEAAYREGEDLPADAADAAIDEAVGAYALVPLGSSPALLAPGPAAFPKLPPGADDLPHILDVERRTVDRARAAAEAERRFREEVDAALGGDGPGGREREDESATLRRLLEVSYDLEAWAAVDVSDCRERLDSHL